MVGFRSVALPRVNVSFSIQLGSVFFKWEGARDFKFGYGDGHCENPEDDGRWVFHYCPALYRAPSFVRAYSDKARGWCVIRHGWFAQGREGWTRELSPRLVSEMGEQGAFQAA